MKILVYGAGVIGSYLAHVLMKGGNEVTILARGQRLLELNKNGLRIRHYLQFKTTVDKANTIETLLPEDVYDLIFVVMQCTHLQAILPSLAANRSAHIIIVGNNPDAGAIQNSIQTDSPVEKKVAFGFQSTGGRRENGKVICVRGGGQMELGGLYEDLTWKPLINKAFMNTKYKLTYYNNMDAWFKCHIALIMPLCFAVYAGDGNLHKAARNKTLLNHIIDAIDEGFAVIKTLGYPFVPAKEEALVREKRFIFYLLLKIVAATPIGKLAVSDHAMSAIEEMSALTREFDALKQKANISTPKWNSLQIHMEKFRS